MSSVIETIERAQLRRVPDFAPGDRVKVHFQVIEGTRRRVQVFEGVVIKRQGHGARETFTVRKQSFGVGVERSFPVHSPKIERIARVRERRYTGPEEAVAPGLLAEPDGATDAEGMTAEEAVMQEADGAEPGADTGSEAAGDAGTEHVSEASGDAAAEPALETGGEPSQERAGAPDGGEAGSEADGSAAPEGSAQPADSA